MSDAYDLVFYYGNKYNLPNSMKLDGYTFKGWSLTKGSFNVDFIENAEIYNYTSVNGKKFIIYPVYEANKYKFVISTISNIEKVLENKIDELILTYDESSILPDSVDFYGYYFKVENVSDLINTF